jgi:Fe-S-cluster containining protein
MLPLSRPYAARSGVPVIDRVDPNIFLDTFFSACMDCTFCHDSCCQFGASIEGPLVEKLRGMADELEPYVGVPRADWFRDEMYEDDEYPGGLYTRTGVRGGKCVFLNRNGRGCLLHRYALEKGLDVHDVKPLACNLFPVLWDQGAFVTPEEIADRTLVCLGDGPTLYRSARGDLLYYFGPELVAELDGLEARVLAERPKTPSPRLASLPLLTA